MKRLRRLEPNVKLIAAFFAAAILISLGHMFVYSVLLDSIRREEQVINAERMNSAQIKLETAFDAVLSAYIELSEDTDALKLPAVEGLGILDLHTMHTEAKQTLDGVAYISNWVLFLPDGSYAVAKSGCYTLDYYADSFFTSPDYDSAFWKACLETVTYRRCLPEGAFTAINGEGRLETKRLLPMLMRSYSDNGIMTVLFLDMEQICGVEDAYLQEGVYLISGEGELLYSTDRNRIITAIPRGETLTAGNETYTVLRRQMGSNLVWVKLLPESETAGMLKGTFRFCLMVVLTGLAMMAVLVPASVKWALAPVNKLVGLLRRDSDSPQDTGNLHGAYQELEEILKSRERQEQALAQKDATLSEYFLHSRMKNVYVDMEPRQEDRDTGAAYILYIQVQYLERSRGCFTASRAELENCLQEMMSGTLNRLFETTMVFQLEPGRFAARVTLPEDENGIGARMERFMKRLENEQEFACFTVVRSEALSTEDDLAQVYNEVQDAARMALVSDRSQLLTLPLEPDGAAVYSFTRQEEQALDAYLRAGEVEQAVDLAQTVLQANLQRGISHAQMELLCVAMVNKAAYVVTELSPSAEKIAAASGVYNTLTSKCGTAAEYRETVTDFIRSVVRSEEPPVEEDDQLLGKVQQYLRENYHREFSSEEMASALWVSRSYLSSYYKSKTGMNLSDSIQLFRIQRAVELLKNPDIKIGDIGPMVGITSSNTFLRHFRKYTGMTPKEYRLTQLSEQ